MEQTHDDAGIIRASLAGDQVAFRQLVGQYQPYIRRIIHGYVKGANNAEDIEQEILIRLHRYLPSYKAQSAFSTWLFRVCVNTILNSLNREKPTISLGDIDAAEISRVTGQYRAKEYSNPENLLTCQETEDNLITTLESLPTPIQESIILHEFSGLTYEQIARRMDSPVGTIRSRIHRARKVLKPFLDAGEQ